MKTKQNPLHNAILAALPPADFEHISPNLEEVEMPLGEVLYESGVQLQLQHISVEIGRASCRERV